MAKTKAQQAAIAISMKKAGKTPKPKMAKVVLLKVVGLVMKKKEIKQCMVKHIIIV